MEEALNIVKQMVEDGQISQEVAEKYCPEIKKYKDEIVRKQILKLIRQHSVNSDRCIMENWVCAHALLPFKPSDEQMATFWDAICTLNHDGYKWINDMKSLYQGLKKLREE